MCVCVCVCCWLGSFVPRRKIRGVQSKIMHKDIIDSYQLKKRKEMQQSLPSTEVVDVDMVNAINMKLCQGFNAKIIIIIKTRCVIVIDDHEASPSSSDCMTLRSDTRS